MHTYVSVPAPGASPPVLGAWIEAYRFVYDSAGTIDDGVRKYGADGRTFKISTPARWIVVSTNLGVLKELKDANESVLSIQAAADERNSIKYILSSSIHRDPYHVKIISKYLTLRLETILPEIVEEVCLIFRETLTVGDEWIQIKDYENLLSRCVSATTNKILVGLPLCRDREYLDCLVQLSKRLSRAGLFCDFVPPILKSLIANSLVRRSRVLQTFLSKLGPVFEQRRMTLASRSGKWEEKPNDVIQGIIKAAPPNTSLYNLCIRILYLDFSAIHTTTISITHALHNLATHTEFQDPIRDEIECVLRNSGGWTKQALKDMRKLDSSLKESQRLHPVTTATLMRKALKPCILSDGTHIPKGQWVVTPAYSINRSAQYHSNPENFDAFRFSRLAELDVRRTRQGIAFPNSGYLSFGIGKYACPGRFFAAAELKVLVAYIICNYDFKMSNNKRPRNKFFSFLYSPDFSAKLLFKKRFSDSD
ncbi:cytochrome P450 [Cenococcum geophilum 1.58]|uniref:Cytochrome P450 n=1 Tax=Cenococcum geophilum 1.58 TaxID=794803 RepID=A0ACC8ELE1_9PEZI|nr:cytochrome P450 [Cenococcum geophilum 1.58]